MTKIDNYLQEDLTKSLSFEGVNVSRVKNKLKESIIGGIDAKKHRCVIYLIDTIKESRASSNNVSLVLDLENKEGLDTLYKNIFQNSTVKFEIHEPLSGCYHAVITDSLGLMWAINYV